MKIEIVGVLVLMFCASFASAGFFSDVFGSITGNVVAGGENFGEFDCASAKVIFNEKYSDYMIPGAVPFTTDVFDVYVDGAFFASFELKEKKVVGMGCEKGEDVSYNIYVTYALIEEISSENENFNPVDFYNEKKKSGDLRIEAVGFINGLKVGFINFGLWIAGFFS